MRFFLMSQGSFYPNIRFLDQKLCLVARSRTDTQTDRATTEGTVSGFLYFSLQSIVYHQGSGNHKIQLLCNGSVICDKSNERVLRKKKKQNKRLREKKQKNNFKTMVSCLHLFSADHFLTSGVRLGVDHVTGQLAAGNKNMASCAG